MSTTWNGSRYPEVASDFQRRPCYRYLRPADRLPSVDAARGEADPILRVRLFNPGGAGTWWIAGYDPPDDDLDPAAVAELAAHGYDATCAGEGWGVAEVHEPEVGSIWMPELVAFRGGFGLPIERDLYFDPCPLSEVLRGAGSR